MAELERNAEAIVNELKQRIERLMRAILECRHLRQADQCGVCQGRTEGGLNIGVILDELNRQGLIHVQPPTDEAGAARPPSRRPASMKTMVGAGIGATFFLAFAGWQGGKLIWRLIKKGQAASEPS